jgi:hypothetical protein
MKKTAISISLILALLVLTIFAVGRANSAPSYPIPTGPLTPPAINMESPTSTTYVSWFVPLQFYVNGIWDGYVQRVTVTLIIDEEPRYVIYDSPFRVKGIAQNFSFTLGPLSEGIHNLQIFASVRGAYRVNPNSSTIITDDFSSQISVYFTVNTANQAQISILSPLNQTYNLNKMIPLEFTINKNSSIVNMGYILDEQSKVVILRNTTLYGPLTDGLHTLKIYSVFSDILPVSSTVNFTVDTTPPKVNILSLQDKIYNSSNIPLVFTVNETTSQITYFLDGKVSSIDGNTTLTGLQDGNHNLIIYATDESGNYEVSQTIDFNVQVPLSPELAYPIIPPMVIVLISTLSLLIYLRRRNQQRKNTDSITN